MLLKNGVFWTCCWKTAFSEHVVGTMLYRSCFLRACHEMFFQKMVLESTFSNENTKRVSHRALCNKNCSGNFPQSQISIHVLAFFSFIIVRDWFLLKNQQKYSKIVGGTLTLKKLATKLWSKKNRFGHLLGFKNVQKWFLWEKFWKSVFFKTLLTKVRSIFKNVGWKTPYWGKNRASFGPDIFGHFSFWECIEFCPNKASRFRIDRVVFE